ncbi:DUF4192 domain-containing protein (plasmid) [Nocardia sp. NBC_01377]|uniref:DUF4192 domain-containing protein n=1 Tax=Nocardia sp. NBC_01377 TaxID=2903595 RepID=UPI002F912B90
MDTSRIQFPQPSGLLSSLPAQLGYFPDQRLLVALIHADIDESAQEPRIAVVEWTLRGYPVDAEPDTEAPDLRTAAQQIGANVSFAVVVDNRHRATTDSPDDVDLRLLTEWGQRLTDIGVPLIRGWAVSEFIDGARWWSVIGPEDHGVLTDCALTPVALERAVTGQPLHRTAEAVTDHFAPDPQLTPLVDGLLPDAHACAEHRRRRATTPRQLADYHREHVEMVLRTIAHTDAGEPLTPTHIAEAAVAISDPVVLSCLLATTHGANPVAAQRTWVLLLAGLTGRERAPVAVLAAYAAYQRGDGTHAGHTLQAALTADPANKLASLLHAALKSGLTPHNASTIAEKGLAAATDLGIDLRGECQVGAVTRE